MTIPTTTEIELARALFPHWRQPEYHAQYLDALKAIASHNAGLHQQIQEQGQKLQTLRRLIEISEAADSGKTDAEIAASATFYEALAYTNVKLLEQERDELKARVAELEKRQTWRDITKEGPPSGSFDDEVRNYCLAIDAKGRASVGYATKYSTGEIFWRFAKPIGEVTHWMPLPEAPAKAINPTV